MGRQGEIDVRFSPGKLEHELLTLCSIKPGAVACIFDCFRDIGTLLNRLDTDYH